MIAASRSMRVVRRTGQIRWSGDRGGPLAARFVPRDSLDVRTGLRVTSRRSSLPRYDSATSGSVPRLDRRGQQFSGITVVAAIERGHAAMEQLFGLALAFGLGTPCTFDVRACPRMPPIEKEHSGPDVDGPVVVPAEVVIETLEEQPLDARLALRSRESVSRRRGGRLEGIRHEDASDYTFWGNYRARGSKGSTVLSWFTMPIIECVPNISEGRRAEVVQAIVAAIAAGPRRLRCSTAHQTRHTTARSLRWLASRPR